MSNQNTEEVSGFEGSHDAMGCVQRTVKRLFDIVFSLAGIIILSPVYLVIAIMLKRQKNGPAIFSQERIGYRGKPFTIYKFRTMSEPEKEPQLVAKSSIGQSTKTELFLREHHLDELPQLWNVLKGDMSLVGPRPERPFFVEKFKEEIPRYMIKHQVRPGMTGWAQVNGYRGDTSIRKRIDCDLYYIENWTMGLDIKILFLTIFKGFVNKNAY